MLKFELSSSIAATACRIALSRAGRTAQPFCHLATVCRQHPARLATSAWVAGRGRRGDGDTAGSGPVTIAPLSFLPLPNRIQWGLP